MRRRRQSSSGYCRLDIFQLCPLEQKKVWFWTVEEQKGRVNRIEEERDSSGQGRGGECSSGQGRGGEMTLGQGNRGERVALDKVEEERWQFWGG